MKIQLEELLHAVELHRGVAQPDIVLALVSVIRKYAGITQELSRVIMCAETTDDIQADVDRMAAAINAVADRMEDARTVDLPGRERTPGGTN